jgi:1,4-dihydroxy-6-naphthoate synthase
MPLAELRGVRVAVPGLTTTAWAVLRMIAGDVQPVVIPIVPYQRIFNALRDGEVDAGLIIHEGRLTWEEQGFHKVVELGTWWTEHVGALPLPLGANALRRDLPESDRIAISDLLRQSIAHALDHRADVVQWLLDKGGALATAEKVSEYLHMYANERTLEYGPEGREGIRVFFERAVAAGVYDAMPDLTMVGDDS